MRFHRLPQEFEDRSTLLCACGDGGPDPLAPAAAGFAACALRDPAVDHDEADRLFRQVVCRFDARCGDELEVGLAMLVEAFGQVLSVLAWRRADSRHANHLRASRFQAACESGLTEVLASFARFPSRSRQSTYGCCHSPRL